ncbi:putative lipoyltransferase 2, mitochondrial, partial [Diaphorina citri]|uniref:Lipoyltransferase 2, mitochondrial n=1 Tax=Diaphorina citri TaxID=121845 RepID=A0A1S3DRT2_DIACI
MTKQVQLVRLGVVSYSNGIKIQEHYVNKLKTLISKPSNHSGTLLLLEHKPVYTIGIRSLKEYDGKVICLNAGPGQLVAYPIVNLKHFTPSIKWFVQSIEQTVIQL